MHTYPEIPNSAQFMLELQNYEAESITGIKAFAQGIDGRSLGPTATGVKSAMDATAKRELGILRRLAEGLKDIARKIMAMNGEFLSEEEVIRVTNDQFVKIKRDDLDGKYDIRLNISTPESDDAKAQELAFMLQTTAQSMGPEFTQIILSDIARLRKMPELAKKIETYQPKPDPLEGRRAELELELLEAQVAEARASGIKQNAAAHLDMAKVNTEQAETGNIVADTALKELDFTEEGAGLKHERELEKEQLKANNALDAKLVTNAAEAEHKLRLEANKLGKP